MDKAKSSREMLEELKNLKPDPTALREFASTIGACPSRHYQPGGPEYGELFHNCLDVINLRQQIEQSDVLSKQTLWVKRYTIATIALVGITFVLAIVTALIAILRGGC